MSRSVDEDRFRGLPSVDSLVRHEDFRPWLTILPRNYVVRVLRETLDGARDEIIRLGIRGDEAAIRQEAVLRLGMLTASPAPVINATGVVLHTNLGRAPLSADALAAMTMAAGYGNLEYDLSRGKRGSRQEHVSALLRVLTGAEAAFVTVNNAAAVLLALTVLARGQEVLVSRGQSVEIGGNFRIPDILEQSGASLVDVGTTNRTRISDYTAGITERTAGILHVHSSNFRIIGFAAEPSVAELAAVCQTHEISLLVDNGSGSLLDTAPFGLEHEPMPEEMLAAGATVVAFSGDKLLGGPQCGILLGSTDIVTRLAAHPLARALRPDKITMAGLAATLQAYVRGEALTTIPIWQIIAQTEGEIRDRALSLQRRAAAFGMCLTIETGQSTVGGGAVPGAMLPTSLLVLPPEIRAEDLRAATPPIVPRTQHDRVQIDVRTVRLLEEQSLLAALRGVDRSERRVRGTGMA